MVFIILLLQAATGVLLFMPEIWQPAVSGQWWIQSLNLPILLQTSGFSMDLARLVFILGCAVLIYSSLYFYEARDKKRTMSLLWAFQIPMIALCLANDFITLFFCFEIISLVSFALIAYDYQNYEIVRNARLILILGIASGLLLLAGFIISFLSHNSADIQTWANIPRAAALCIVLSACIKSAQFPFSFWLPSAMSAPTPASAFLHSATLVKAGLIVLLKLLPGLELSGILHLLLPLGLFTALVSSFLALVQSDMKASLAYSTLTALGLLTAILGSGSGNSAEIFLSFAFAHACYKAPWFLHLGYLEKTSGSRRWREVQSKISWSGFMTGALLCALVVGILMPNAGSAKLLVIQSMQELAVITELVLALIFANSAVLALWYIRTSLPIGSTTMVGPKDWLLLPVLIPPVLFFSMPLPIVPEIEGSSVKALSWMIAGLWIAVAELVRTAIRRLEFLEHFAVANQFEWLILLPTRCVNGLSRLLIHSDPRRNLQTMLWFACLLLLVPYALFGLPALPAQLPFDWGIALLCLMSASCAVSILVYPAKLPTIMALSGIGLSQTLIFFELGALDVAKTQLLVETISLFLVAYILFRMPNLVLDRPTLPADWWLRVALACVGAIGLYIATAAALTPFASNEVSQFYLDNSLVLAFGQNVVNVILVDFRALDTMGEVTVLAMAAVGLQLLFKNKSKEISS